MEKWTRREALAGITVAGGSLLVGCGAPVIPNDKVFQMPACANDAIIDSLLNEAKDALPVLEKWLVEKTPVDALYSAALTAGARSTIVEDDLHTVLVVNAAYLMAKRIPASEQLVPLFYAWNRVQSAANTVRNQNPPPLSPFEAAKVPPAAEAESKLRTALDAWDAPSAEAAVVSLYAAGGREAVIGLLTRYGQRNHVWVGHGAIWTAYAIRCLDALGWECAPWILRSLVRTYVANRSNSSTPAFDSNLMRVNEVPATFRDGTDDPAAVIPLLTILRTGTATACVDAVIARLNAGTSRRTIWTALALAAVELSIRYQEFSFGVHALDTVNALRNLQGLTPDRDTEALTMLQAAAWRPEFRALVKGTVTLDETIDAITPRPGLPRHSPSASTRSAAIRSRPPTPSPRSSPMVGRRKRSSPATRRWS